MVAKNPAQASTYVKQLASDPSLRNQLAAAAREGILDKHRIEAVANQWEAVIEKIVKE